MVGNSRTSGNARDSPPFLLLRKEALLGSLGVQVYSTIRQSADAASSLICLVTFWTNYLRRKGPLLTRITLSEAFASVTFAARWRALAISEL